jgi:hypothetical protein
MRRVQDALIAYTQAAVRVAAFLEKCRPDSPHIRRYYAAVAQWENFCIHCSMSMDLFKWMNDGCSAFEKNDASPEQRLYTIANQVKHTASCIRSGQCRPEHTIPLWLSNNGLESFNVSVSYDEAAETLRSLCKLAGELQDPVSFAQSRLG